MVSIKPLLESPPGAPMSVSRRSTRDLTTGTWRTFRPVYVTRAAPCTLECPAGTDVRAFLSAAADGNAEGAWRTIRMHNPLPGVCGRVCYHPCERDCSRRALDEPVAIHAVERSVAEEARHRQFDIGETPSSREIEVAVVGAGPAGLSCAYHLSRRGYAVTVFDAHPEPGGMLRYGIPAYRLPRPALDAEIGLLRALGIRFVGDARFGVNRSLAELDAYPATFVAIGAQRSRRIGVPGEQLAGVRSGVEFLREVNAGTVKPIPGRAIVIGGGNTALDTARVARRLGAAVTIVYRRSREDMPAHPDEIAQVEAEDIEIIFNAAPVRLVGRDDRLARVDFQRMRPGPPDASGRPRPEPIPGATFELPAAHAFTAVGEEVELDLVAGLLESERGLVLADRWGRTGRRAVFAGGDAATGAGTVVEAIGSGRAAAEGIDAYFSGADLIDTASAARVGPADLNLFYFDPHARVRPRLLFPERALSGFAEVVGDLAWAEAMIEARRCLTCGACTACDNCLVFCPDAAIRRNPTSGFYDIDLAHCKGCGLCAAECPHGAVTLVSEEQR